MADNTEDFEPTDGARGEDAGRDGAFDEMLSRAEADYDAESGAGERGDARRTELARDAEADGASDGTDGETEDEGESATRLTGVGVSDEDRARSLIDTSSFGAPHGSISSRGPTAAREPSSARPTWARRCKRRSSSTR